MKVFVLQMVLTKFLDSLSVSWSETWIEFPLRFTVKVKGLGKLQWFNKSKEVKNMQPPKSLDFFPIHLYVKGKQVLEASVRKTAWLSALVSSCTSTPSTTHNLISTTTTLSKKKSLEWSVWSFYFYPTSESLTGSENSCSKKIIYYTPSCNLKKKIDRLSIFMILSVFHQKCSELCAPYSLRCRLTTHQAQRGGQNSHRPSPPRACAAVDISWDWHLTYRRCFHFIYVK